MSIKYKVCYICIQIIIKLMHILIIILISNGLSDKLKNLKKKNISLCVESKPLNNISIKILCTGVQIL